VEALAVGTRVETDAVACLDMVGKQPVRVQQPEIP